jgi:hypothetical protein
MTSICNQWSMTDSALIPPSSAREATDCNVDAIDAGEPGQSNLTMCNPTRMPARSP